MIHIDHSLLNNPPSSPPRPALPILASHLLDLEEKQRRRFTGEGRDERLSTGCKEVDEVLGAGVERGVVLGISAGAEGREGRLLSLHLLASVLLPNLSPPTKTHVSPSSPPKTKATIIDTTGSFPLALLASVLKSRLLEIQALAAQNAIKTGNYAVQESGKSAVLTGKNGVEIDEQVQKCLEMVAISRVFDVEGLWEVIGEVDHVDSASLDHGSRDQDGKGGENIGVAGGGDEAVEPDAADDQPEILDSEEELTPPVSPIVLNDQTEETSEDEGTEIIIVDNMTHIINDLFARKEKNDAHTLLTLLSTTLHTLSATNNILTILHNTTNASTSSKSNTNPLYPPPQTTHPKNPQSRNPNFNRTALHATTAHSIFLSATTKPALGQIFAQFPDLHIFMHRLPKGRGDAEALCGGVESPVSDEARDSTRAIKYTTILEILKDEAPTPAPLIDGADSQEARQFGYREQKWTALELDAASGGLCLIGAFQEKGGMRGMGMSRERGGTRVEEGLSGGVGNVAKVWGFGGRRV
ncbi:hypothetical protein VTL71DRAFT_15379 [Oculimacula yallundae]|uniref:Uncharacterized protein n=1 Tax=Oculimacula yallundae TaxID=86028 RepID=A0ABR4CGE1_9HELO